MRRIPGPTALSLVALVVTLAGPAPALGQPSCDEIDPPGVLLDDEICVGWVRDGGFQTAYAIEELADIINGAAFLYGQYGFIAAAFQNYSGEVGDLPTFVTQGVFNQGTTENAESLYGDPNSGSGDPVEDWGGTGQARMRIAFGTVSFEFWEACFFVSVIVVTGGEEAVPHARCFADEALVRIQDPAPVDSQTWGSLKAFFR